MRWILFCDDEPRILEALQRMLRSRRQEWEMRFATGPAAAIGMLREAPADVVVTDMRMPDMDGAELLEQVKAEWPTTVRVVLSGQTDLSATTRAVRVAHQFLSKPCDALDLHATIERLCLLRELLDEAVRHAVGTVETLPCIPAVYARLEQALAQPDVVLAAIAAIVERDAALGAKLLQLVNSSFFGRPRRVTTVEQAVGLLGVSVLRSLVLSHEIAGSFAASGAATILSLEELQQHALLVGGIARRLAPTPAEADAAFMAGVLHDMGKLLLAARLPDEFRRALADAARDGVPLHEAEQAAGGASHAEVGAYLLGLWGLPADIVSAVAYHHRPARAASAHTAIVAAVHAADVFAHELGRAPGDARAMPALDEAWLSEQGLAGQLERWRALAREVTEAQP